MKSYIIIQLLIILEIISFSICYNNSDLKKVTANDLIGKSGYEGCYALYDSGANETETCTQFKLENPYICCKVHFEIGDFHNDFCMPIANNTKALGDVEYAFRHASNVEIDCYSLIFKFSFYLVFILFILLI